MVEKAGAFEVALPGVGVATAGGSSGDNSVGDNRDTSSTSSSIGGATTSDKQEEKLAGVWLSFYAQIYVLKVPSAQLVLTIVRLALTMHLLQL